jgi:uncharacterized protein (TIGR03067 family)
MRTLIISLFLLLTIGCATTRNSKGNSHNLNGTWLPVRQEMGGALLPDSFFAHQKLIMSDTSYTVMAESIDKGVVKYGDGKMDIYGKDGVNAGKHFTAIYKYENEQLTVCYNLLGDSYPATFETKPKTLLFLSVFNKEK